MSYAKAKAKHDATAGNGGAPEGQVSQALMCTAHGCPNLWSTSIGHVCRWHADAEPERWPEVTQQQQWDETERARLGKPERPPTRTFSDPDRMRAAFRRFADRLRERDALPKAWAHKLKAREEAGEKLGPVQRDAWRAALGHRFVDEEAS